MAYQKDVNLIAYSLAGYGPWQCYNNPILSGRYLQIGAGKTPDVWHTGNPKPIPGGHPGCFWNPDTVTDSSYKVWDSNPEKIRKHVSVRMRQLANESRTPCHGCLFPRLVFDEPSLVAGIADEKVKHAYLAIRKEIAGF